MTRRALAPLLFASAMLAACAGTTPISKLALPPVTTIEGTVTKLAPKGFTLMDASGTILVRAEPESGKKLDLAPGEKVKVFGNLLGGPQRVFDGYVIRKASGEQIIVSEPSPHFGFVLQTGFR